MMADVQGHINLIASGVQYALFVGFTTVMFFYIDRMGRRPLLIYRALAVATCHIVVGSILSAGDLVLDNVGGNKKVVIRVTRGKASTIIGFCYFMIIVYGLRPTLIRWIYAAEIWNLETCAADMGIAALGNWLFNFPLLLDVCPGFQSIR